MVLNLLFLCIPISVLLRYLLHASPMWVFLTAFLSIIPLSDGIRKGTEEMARHAGPAIGGLLNITFGNVSELVLALFILSTGVTEVVKAQITGSIIGNSLLGLGMAILVGSWGREKQQFKPERAGLLSSLLVLSVIALLVPALFDFTEKGLYATLHPVLPEARLSMGVSCVLIFTYLANLVYTFFTHRDVFAFAEEREPPKGSLWRAIGVLLLGTALISLESELVSGALEGTARALGLSELFLGVIPLAVVGNISEYFSAIYFARQNRMGLVITITVGSSIQMALFTAPLLVILSQVFAHPMNLIFNNPLELVAIAGAAVAVNTIAQDGETTWFEGVLLLAVYALIGMAFLWATP